MHYTKMIQNAFHLFCTVPESGLAADMGPSAITWFIWCNYDAMRVKEVTHTHTFTLFKGVAIFAFRTGFRTGYTQYRKMNLIFCAWVWQGNLVISCNILCLFHDLKQLEWRTFWIVWEACRKMEASASEKATALADLEASFCLMNCSGSCRDLFGVHRREAKLPNLQSK